MVHHGEGVGHGGVKRKTKAGFGNVRKLPSGRFQRLGRMLSGNYKIHTSRPDANGPRGYTFASLSTAFSPLRSHGQWDAG